MSGRSKAAWRLAGELVAAAGVPVRLEWQGRSPRPDGGWHVAWCDGPTVEQMRGLVRSVPAAEPIAVRAYDRGSSDLGEAAALLAYVAEQPGQGPWVSGYLVQEAHSRTAYPDRGDVELLNRARALLAACGGTCGAAALRGLRTHATRGGWPAVQQWLDELVAAAADPSVPVLAEARRRRGGGEGSVAGARG